jgi:hypothetical protein
MTAQLWLSTNLVRLQKAVFCVPTARSLARAGTVIALAVEVSPAHSQQSTGWND